MSGTGIIYSNSNEMVENSLFHQPIGEAYQNAVSNFNNYINVAGEMLTPFISAVKDSYEKIASSAAMNQIAHFKRRIESMWEPNSIRSLYAIGDVQNAPEIMRPYLLAQPMLREYVWDGRASGWDTTLVHEYAIPEHNPAYRAVMNGIMVSADPETDQKSHWVNYYGGETKLDHLDKGHILSTWAAIENFLNEDKEDPSSVWGRQL